MTAVRHTLITSAEIITLIYFDCAYSIKTFECTRSAISIEVTARAKAIYQVRGCSILDSQSAQV